MMSDEKPSVEDRLAAIELMLHRLSGALHGRVSIFPYWMKPPGQGGGRDSSPFEGVQDFWAVRAMEVEDALKRMPDDEPVTRASPSPPVVIPLSVPVPKPKRVRVTAPKVTKRGARGAP